MKKLILCVILFLAMHATFAQLYVRASVGYNLPLSPELIGTERKYEEIPNQGYNEEYTGVYGSYGSGFSAGIAIGGSFGTSMLGYDVAFSYLGGKKYSVKSTSHTQFYDSWEEETYQSNSFQFNPSITINVGAGKFQPFARFGPTISLTKLNEERSTFSSYDENEYSMNFEYSGGIAVGLHGSFGVTYAISEQLKLFSEINLVSISYGPHKRTITEYTVDGEDRLDTIAEEYREVDLEKSAKTENEEQDPVMREPFALNSWGLQIGVQFSFGQ